MTDQDFQALADLWQQEPDRDERDLFEAAGRKVRRRARLLGFADIALASLIIAGMILGFLLRPGAYSAIIAGTLITATIWLSIKRRAVRQMSRTLDTTSRQAFIASSIRNANASLWRIMLSLGFLPTGALLAVLFKLNLRSGGHLDHPLAALAAWSVSTRGVIGLTGLAIMLAFLIRSWRRCRAELRRLELLKNAYAKAETLENASDGSIHAPDIR